MSRETTPLILRIGIDALHLYNLGCMKINYDILNCGKEMGKNIKYENYPVVDPYQDQTVEYIKIIDNCMFADLIIVKKYIAGGGRRTTVNLTLSPHHVRGNNLNNLSVDEYTCYLADLKGYIDETYGIELDFYEARVKEMEINCTFPLSHAFADYKRIMKLLLLLFPRLKKISNTEDIIKTRTGGRFITESFWRENKSIKIIVYDKSNEMRDNDHCDVNKNLMRIEIGLKNQKKIKDALGTNLMRDITDEMIAGYYYETLCLDIHNRYEKWHAQNLKALPRFINSHRIDEKTGKAKRSQWPLETLLHALNLEDEDNRTPVVLDVNDLKDQFPSDRHNNRARSVAAFDHYTEKAHIFFRGDREKEPEVMGWIEAAYQNSISPSSDDVIKVPINGENIRNI